MTITVNALDAERIQGYQILVSKLEKRINELAQQAGQLKQDKHQLTAQLQAAHEQHDRQLRLIVRARECAE